MGRVDESSRGVRADCERMIGGEGGREAGREGGGGNGGWGERKFTEAICC